MQKTHGWYASYDIYKLKNIPYRSEKKESQHEQFLQGISINNFKGDEGRDVRARCGAGAR